MNSGVRVLRSRVKEWECVASGFGEVCVCVCAQCQFGDNNIGTVGLNS